MNKTYLYHHGIKGQRWGVRRFQNEDGTLTPSGEKRYGTAENMDRVRSRNRKIMVGAGVAAATVGAAVIINKNRKLKRELGVHRGKEAARAANWAKAQEVRKANIAKRAADVAAGITTPSKKVKIATGSDVIIKVTKGAKQSTTELINVLGGVVKVKGGV